MIALENVTKAFHSGRGHVQALRGVSFELEGGASLAVLGASGSGKTTLLHCIGGLEHPDQGKIWCFGKQVDALGGKDLSSFLRREVGFIFQYGNLLDHLTVYENVAFPLALNGWNRFAGRGRVLELLAGVGLEGAGKALPRELSGGEIQRVAVARALAHGPKLLLGDEPTANLDSMTGKKVVDLLLGLAARQGTTAILATHDPEVAGRTAYSIRLKDGKITEASL